MSNENDTSQEPWEEPAEENNEAETQPRQMQRRSSRDAYDRRPGRRPDPSRNADPRQGYDAYGRPRHGTRSYRDAYEDTTEPHRERSRTARDFHERPDPYDELDDRYHRQHRM